MIRVLHIASSLDRNGTETFIMNVYRNIDRSKVQFDFLVCKITEEGYEREARELGARIYHYHPRRDGLMKHFKSLYSFFSRHAGEYDVVHYNSNSFTSALPLRMAKYFNVGIRVAHSHSTSTRGLHHRVLHRLNRMKIRSLATHYVACSEAARKWGFARSGVLKKSEIVSNGIETGKFCFNPSVRVEIRKELGIENKFVVGHVSNFLPVKNHPFMLEILSELKKLIPEATLLFVGDGNRRLFIEKLACEKGMEDSVIFTGIRHDVNRLLQGMDIFLFPSFFEGLPFAVVEAQASGLPVFASDTLPPEIAVTNLITFLSLESSAYEWAKKIAEVKNQEFDRTSISELKAFDINTTCRQLMKIYGVKDP